MSAKFRRSTKVRQANENYGAYDLKADRGGNLTPLQRRYARWWDAVRPYQMGGAEMTSAVYGFKCRKVNGKFVPLTSETRIRTVDSLLLLSITPIPKALFQPGDSQQHGRYRLHFSEQVGFVRDGEVCFGGKFVGERRVDPYQHRQAALDKRPLQDHQIYADREYKPGGLGDQMMEAAGHESEEALVRTPIYGNFAVVRDDLFIRLTIEGFDLYRFDKASEAAFEIVAPYGEVTPGQVLAKLVAPVTFGVAEPWASKPDSKATRPIVDAIEGDSLSATHYVPQLSFAVQALEGMLMRDEGHAVFGGEDCWPIPLVRVPWDVFKARRQHDWEPNAAFKQALLQAVSPDSLSDENVFALRMPCNGRITAVVSHCGYKIVHIEKAGEGEITVPLPICAEVRDNLSEHLYEGQIIADYMPRGYYESYEQLVEVAQGCIVKVEDAFLEQLVIRPGQTNWSGSGVLLDERYAGALRVHCADRLLDMAPVLPYLDDQYGIATLPAVEFDVRVHGFERVTNGIRYNVTPMGAMFAKMDLNAPEPLRETQTRTRFKKYGKQGRAVKRRPQKR